MYHPLPDVERREDVCGGFQVSATTRQAGWRVQGESAIRSARVPKRRRVLVVDDEPMIGATLRVVLADEYDVMVVDSGREARRVLEADPAFDAILCDLMMSDVSGMELYEWVRATSAALADRMIFMTGGAYTERARRFLESTANARIDKPFDTDELLDLMRRGVPDTAVSSQGAS